MLAVTRAAAVFCMHMHSLDPVLVWPSERGDISVDVAPRM